MTKPPLEALQSLGNSIVQETLDECLRKLNAYGFTDVCIIGTVLTPDSDLSTVMCRAIGPKLEVVSSKQHEACLQILLSELGGDGAVGPAVVTGPTLLN